MPDPDPVPTVTFHLWRVAHPGRAFARVATDRFAVRRCPGLRFARILGTASGRSYAPRDAELSRWAILACWSGPEPAAEFDRSRLVQRWEGDATESWSARLQPSSARGRWSGQLPFGDPHRPDPGGPVVAITRARLHPLRSRRFRRAVRPVVRQLAGTDGLIFGLGIGEWPIGLQGTFSAWTSSAALRRFAYSPGAHDEVIRRTPGEGWFTEELFARFSIIRCAGRVDGIELVR